MCGTTQQILPNCANHQYKIFMATILLHNVKIARVGQHSNFSATIVNKQTPARGCLESFHTADYMPLLQTNPHVYLLIAQPCISQMNSRMHRPIMQPLF